MGSQPFREQRQREPAFLPRSGWRLPKAVLKRAQQERSHRLSWCLRHRCVLCLCGKLGEAYYILTCRLGYITLHTEVMTLSVDLPLGRQDIPKQSWCGSRGEWQLQATGDPGTKGERQGRTCVSVS